MITAVVSVADQTSGRVVLRSPNFAGQRTVRGAWRLNDGELTVRWDKQATKLDSNVGPTHGRHISLDANRIGIRGEMLQPRRTGDWVRVGVDRRSRSVTFRFPLDREDRAVMTCQKR